MAETIDLIYVRRGEEKTMSVVLVEGDKRELIGPVPSRDAVKALAPLLLEKRPTSFPGVREAERYLMVVHFRNMSQNQNAGGQPYPFEEL